jgi:hypothetical protein
MNIAGRAAPWLAVLFLLLSACGGGEDSDRSANQAPVISGTPSSQATAGRSWSFQPSLSDPDGDTLTVSATNLPGWLTLNPSTGLVQGTPGEGDVRTWSNIRLAVSDGIASATLPAFSINVLPTGAAMGTATLSWSPPTERADGSPIGELAGYEVLYGQQSRNYDTTIELNNPGLTRYVIEGLGPGTWYFAVKAVTTDGLESAPSQEVSKRI